MKRTLLALTLSIFCIQISADNIFRIEASPTYREPTNQDLKRRVWRLERAVWQMQQKIYHLQANPTAGQADTWVCTLSPFSRKYSETGASKAVAKANVINACTKGESSGFHCREPKCEN